MAQALVNSRLCAEGRRPICQDTGIVNVFLKAGMDIRRDSDTGIDAMVNAAVRKACTNPDNPLHALVVSDPAGSRVNTGVNTPAVVHMDIVPGDRLEVTVAPGAATPGTRHVLPSRIPLPGWFRRPSAPRE